LHADDLWAIFGFGVEEFGGEFCDSGVMLVHLSCSISKLTDGIDMNGREKGWFFGVGKKYSDMMGFWSFEARK
jgi:hypothetical protein